MAALFRGAPPRKTGSVDSDLFFVPSPPPIDRWPHFVLLSNWNREKSAPVGTSEPGTDRFLKTPFHTLP